MIDDRQLTDEEFEAWLRDVLFSEPPPPLPDELVERIVASIAEEEGRRQRGAKLSHILILGSLLPIARGFGGATPSTIDLLTLFILGASFAWLALRIQWADLFKGR